MFSKQISTAISPGFERLRCLGRVLVAEQTGAGSLEDLHLAEPVAVEVLDLDTGDASVHVLLDHVHIEHPDDPAFDEIHEQGDRLSGSRRIRRIADDDDVDGTEFQLLAAQGSSFVGRSSAQETSTWTTTPDAPTRSGAAECSAETLLAPDGREAESAAARVIGMPVYGARDTGLPRPMFATSSDTTVTR